LFLVDFDGIEVVFEKQVGHPEKEEKEGSEKDDCGQLHNVLN